MISIVVPAWNEEQNITPFIEEVKKCIAGVDYEIIFSLDPCTDRTIDVIRQHASTDRRIKAIVMSRRFGQPMATLAGLEVCSGDCAIVMDVDLQDPPSLLPELIDKWREGYEVVLPQRRQRFGENPIRLLVARLAYKLIDRFSQINMPRNVSDFRLVDRKVIDIINSMGERHGYLRGMVAYAGFNTTYVKFDRPARYTGESKYNALLGSLKIGGNGVFAYSTLGLSVIFNIGLVLGFVSILSALGYAVAKFAGFPFPIGNPTIVISIYGTAGLNMLGLAIVGQYIERIYEETRTRPRYIIANRFNV